MRSPYPTHRHAAAACREDKPAPCRPTPRSGSTPGPRSSRKSIACTGGSGTARPRMLRSPSSASAPSCRPKEGSVVTPALDRAARDRPLSHPSKCLAGQLCRTPSRRSARRHRADRSNGQLPGQPPHEQIPADAMVLPRRRSPAPGPLRRPQRQTWFQLRPPVPGRRSRLRAGHGGLTPQSLGSPMVDSI